MRHAPAYRGQPLVALMLVFGGWIALRVIVWEWGGLGAPLRAMPGYAAEAQAVSVVATKIDSEAVQNARRELAMGRKPVKLRTEPAVPLFLPPVLHPQPSGPSRQPLVLRPARSSEAPPFAPVPPHLSAAHQLLWMAALARLPLPDSLLAPPPTSVVPPVPVSARGQADDRPHWSADGWLLLRRGGQAGTASGFAPPTYGASQAGAVVRYRLAPASPQRPTAYLRGSAALNGSREREAALGLSARPIAGLPVVVAAEARANSQPTGTHLRPAVFAYTELPPFALPLGTRGELYGQGGYVGGDFATGFVDGQLRVDRRVARLGKGELRAGGGVWGGAQRGASRLDFGPTATLGMELGGSAGARLGLDWRFRVAGVAGQKIGTKMRDNNHRFQVG